MMTSVNALIPLGCPCLLDMLLWFGFVEALRNSFPGGCVASDAAGLANVTLGGSASWDGSAQSRCQ
eukprot:scaffold651072_cov38-Prasinocladus_malaysianus.AAC.1